MQLVNRHTSSTTSAAANRRSGEHFAPGTAGALPTASASARGGQSWPAHQWAMPWKLLILNSPFREEKSSRPQVAPARQRPNAPIPKPRGWAVGPICQATRDWVLLAVPQERSERF